MMRGYGQRVPGSPEMPSPADRLTRARLIIEEALEYCEAAGIAVTFGDQAIALHDLSFEHNCFERGAENAKPNFVEMADALADLSVVTHGGLASMGLPDVLLLEEVDDNNIQKIRNGHLDPTTGKFLKHPNHRPPDITRLLRSIGTPEELLA